MPVSGTSSPKHGASSKAGFIAVEMEVREEHPLLVLYRRVKWERVERILGDIWRRAGKNVDGGRQGRRFDVAFFCRALVLGLILGKLTSRELERELKENAVARVFVGVAKPLEGLWRDHSNLERAFQALGAEGFVALGELVREGAIENGFMRAGELSSDMTCQQAHIGYPTDVGTLEKVARSGLRLMKRLGKKAREVVGEELGEKLVAALKLGKHYHLFARDKEEKAETLREMCQLVGRGVRELGQAAKSAVERVKEGAESARSAAVEKAQVYLEKVEVKVGELTSFTERFIPQVRHWVETGKAVAGKLLHPTIQEAASLKTGKRGREWAYGFKWLINRFAGGYLSVEMFLGSPNEKDMPLHALGHYEAEFGEGERPELQVYDRGGHSKRTIDELKKAGVEKIGIQPKGKGSWLVGESDQVTVMKLRSRTEGVIGTLKEAYKFDKPKQRSRRTIEMAGHASAVSYNLNKFLQDISKQDQEDRMAA